MHRVLWLLAAAIIVAAAGCSAPADDAVDTGMPAAAGSEVAASAEGLAMDAPGKGYVAVGAAARAETRASHSATSQAGSVALPDGQAPVSAVAASESGLTPGEAAFLPEGNIDAGRLAVQMRGDLWDETVARFAADAAVDPDARELQALYEQALRESLDRHGLVLVQFGCGLSLCAGTARRPLPEDGYRFATSNILDLGEGLPTPMRAFRQLETAQYMELRFSFSTDPALRTITIRR